MNESSPSGQGGPRFVLYSRSWCHLCDDMLAALRACMARQGLPFTVDVVDVDADPGLVARFDELVPVLFMDGADAELCHYFLDEAAVLRQLGLHQAEPAGAE
jgi:hypothetical protein